MICCTTFKCKFKSNGEPYSQLTFSWSCVLSIARSWCKMSIYPSRQSYLLYSLYGAQWAENMITNVRYDILYKNIPLLSYTLAYKQKPEGTHSRFSLSTPPPPLAWACCLIYPWSSALLHTSKSTLARSTCYYLLARLLRCQKHTQTWASLGAVTPVKQEKHAFVLGTKKNSHSS